MGTDALSEMVGGRVWAYVFLVVRGTHHALHGLRAYGAQKWSPAFVMLSQRGKEVHASKGRK